MKQCKAKQFWLDSYVALIVALVGLLRISYASVNSITQDESTMILFARGVIERGYPFLRQTVGEFIISTYELIPYPIALATLLLGDNETAVRLPAAIFSMLTAWLLFCYGNKLFNPRTAVIVVSVYCLLPWSLYWGCNAFYPAQLQFFALLCIMSVHTLLTKDLLTRWDYYQTSVFFTLMYLSWEGSGVLLPVFFITALLLKWGNWGWLANGHAWVSGVLVVFVVVAQLTYRTLLREPFTVLGSSRSNVSTLSFTFLNADFDPLFYINSLFSEAHILLLALFAFGVFFLKSNGNLRYLLAIVSFSVFILSFFLGYFALRYVYFLLPLILLMASAVMVILIDEFGQHAAHAKLTYSFSLLLMLAVCSPWGIKPTQLSESLQKNRPFELRRDLSAFRFRPVNLALREHYRKGDIVVVQAPFPTQVYLGMTGNYFLQAQTATSVVYDAKQPYYLDKWRGNPVLTSLKALIEVLQKNPRVWIVAVPDGAAMLSFGKDITGYVNTHFCVVSEATDGRLLLWENPLFVKQTTCSLS